MTEPTWEFQQLSQAEKPIQTIAPKPKIQTFEDILDEEDSNLRRQRKKSEHLNQSDATTLKTSKKKAKKGVRKDSQNDQWGLKMHSDEEIDFEDVMK